MTYLVVLQRLAVDDLMAAYRYAYERAPIQSTDWLERFQASISSLSNHPQRCALARENGKVDAEIREFHFGHKPYVFRVLFSVDGKTVRVLRIRRAQQRYLSQTEAEQALRDQGV